MDFLAVLKDHWGDEDNRRIMIVWVGAILSLFLLLLFGTLQQYQATFLSLDSKWISLAVLPVIVALIVGRYIESFKGFGVELVVALKSPVSASIDMIRAEDSMAAPPGEDKQSLSRLSQMPPEQKESIKRLVFEAGKKRFY